MTLARNHKHENNGRLINATALLTISYVNELPDSLESLAESLKQQNKEDLASFTLRSLIQSEPALLIMIVFRGSCSVVDSETRGAINQ